MRIMQPNCRRLDAVFDATNSGSQIGKACATLTGWSGSEFFLIYSLRHDVIDGTKRRFEFEVTKEIAEFQAADLNNTAAFSALA
jgi:hypothetical protein